MLLKCIETSGLSQRTAGRSWMQAISLAVLVGLSPQSLAAAGKAYPYANETAFRFTAASGESTDAFRGFFLVPENRQRAGSRLLKLHYVRFPATTAQPGAPIVYLAGGPGGSGIHTAKGRRYPLFTGLTAQADVIALDQRGTGLSADMPVCQSKVAVPTKQRIDEQQFAALHRQAAAECQQFWQQQGADLLGYTTVQNALDLDALRQHLGADKLTLWGISYGTHLALAASKLMPERLDKLVLASVEGLDQTVKLPAETVLYLQRVQQLIALDPALQARFGDITVLMQQVLTGLDRQPLQLRLAQADGSSRSFLFQRLHLQILTSMSLADPNPRLGQLLQLYYGLKTQSAETKTALLELLQSGVLDGFAAGPIALQMMPLLTDIASGISETRLAQYQQQHSTALLGGMLNFPMPQLNNTVAGLDLGAAFRQEATHAIPTLVLSGTLDGRTYLAEQQQAVAGLSARQQVTVRYAGHNLLESSPQVLATIQQFLSTGKVKQPLIELPVPQLGL
ncbi:alpha/beta fold hydrolase [Rheinheimera texasensis]|uniref:alpha/beta fold hydrolase n=1 Tax=Rheinheimera texasensis TaxID=306205 RepID=UPI000AB22675|nr:alpha/beta hydrolase [Rheinheimera texasensis]